MLELYVEGQECWDDDLEQFISTNPITLHLEHSLLSISKWEQKFHKPYLETNNKTSEEMIYYFKCMTITKNVKDEVYNLLSEKNILEINDYINDPMTATWFNDTRTPRPRRKQIQTSELIYYQMLSYGIPMECEKWHLNRLITLIRVFNHASEDANHPKKMSKSELMRRNRELNEQRIRAHNSRV